VALIREDEEPAAVAAPDAEAQRRRLNAVAVFGGCTLAIAVLF
jgi:hypothetical protein